MKGWIISLVVLVCVLFVSGCVNTTEKVVPVAVMEHTCGDSIDCIEKAVILNEGCIKELGEGNTKSYSMCLRSFGGKYLAGCGCWKSEDRVCAFCCTPENCKENFCGSANEFQGKLSAGDIPCMDSRQFL